MNLLLLFIILWRKITLSGDLTLEGHLIMVGNHTSEKTILWGKLQGGLSLGEGISMVGNIKLRGDLTFKSNHKLKENILLGKNLT